MARLVEDHCDLTLPDEDPISERELVFLADKHVRDSFPVSPRVRFQSRVVRFAGDAGACAVLAARRDRALAPAERFARECGRDPELHAGQPPGLPGQERMPD